VAKISIITATYNNAATIADTIKSLEQQTVNFEWIIQDAMSKDATLDMIRTSTLSANILSEKDHGLYDALNRAIERCTANVIGLCHADDMLASEDVLMTVQAYFDEHPSCEALYLDLEYWNETFTKRIRKWVSGKAENMIFGWMPPHPTVFVRKSVFDAVGYYRTDIGSAADFEWMLRAIKTHKIPFHYIPKLAVKMRVGGMSSSGVKSRIAAFKGDYKAWTLNGYSFPIFQVGIKKLRKISQFF
jgi:glycosyltransferase